MDKRNEAGTGGYPVSSGAYSETKRAFIQMAEKKRFSCNEAIIKLPVFRLK
jgi:hypothetical protein